MPAPVIQLPAGISAARPEAMVVKEFGNAAVDDVDDARLGHLVVTRLEEGADAGFVTASAPAVSRRQQSLALVGQALTPYKAS
jgi:hypothetical protein